MSKRIPIKLILRLLSLQVGYNQIARNYHISKNSIQAVARIAKEKNITFLSRKDATEQQLYQEFFPEKVQAFSLYRPVSYEAVHIRLAKKGVTLKALWQVYKHACDESDQLAGGYAKFCRDYHSYVNKNGLVDHLIYKPGVMAKIEWLDFPFEIHAASGKIQKVYVFMGQLLFSQYSFIELCSKRKEQSFALSTMHFYASLGGVPTKTIGSHLMQSQSKQRRGLNKEYGRLSHYYGTEVLSPKCCKNVATSQTGSTLAAKIMRVQSQKFVDEASLQTCLKSLVSAYNEEMLGSSGKRRCDVFLSEEKPQLQQLPSVPYQWGMWVYHTRVNADSCVVYKKNYYSCAPLSFGTFVDVKIDKNHLSIYAQGIKKEYYTIFSATERGRKRRNAYDLFMAREKLKQDLVRLRKEASSIGPPLVLAIDCIVAHEKNVQKALSAGTSVFRLHHQYGKERLLGACRYAFKKKNIPTYRLLKSILANEREERINLCTMSTAKGIRK